MATNFLFIRAAQFPHDIAGLVDLRRHPASASDSLTRRSALRFLKWRCGISVMRSCWSLTQEILGREQSKRRGLARCRRAVNLGPGVAHGKDGGRTG